MTTPEEQTSPFESLSAEVREKFWSVAMETWARITLSRRGQDATPANIGAVKEELSTNVAEKGPIGDRAREELAEVIAQIVNGIARERRARTAIA